MKSPTAREQEQAFAAKVRNSPEFAKWLLRYTKFKGLDVEPILVRSDNPWYQSRKTGRQSETDILLVLFAIHIENKRLRDKFQPDQPELYHERAADWVGMAKWGNYHDFQCILLAPKGFIEINRPKADIFHNYITHEELSPFIVEFSARSPEVIGTKIRGQE
jgi:hypothetical protein